MTRLSKSRIMSSLQCLRRVWLEARRPELAHYSSDAQAAFTTGHAVGDIAVRLYDRDGQGTYIDYRGGGFSRQLAQTGELMTSMFRSPVFEATLRHEGVLVREDVLLPVETDEGPSWRIVEVKASTSVKDQHVHDCAVQAWVHLGAGYPLNGIALAHVDNRFEYPGDQRYEGLLVEEDLTAQVLELLPSVPVWIANARQAVEGPEPEVPVGQHCTSPYDCPFKDHCWPNDTRYPILGLGGSKKKLGTWVMDGYRDIRDVPASEITSENQLRVHRVTAAGEPEILPGAKNQLMALPWPRFYLDFETIGPAIPVWPGTRPYQQLPIQWSCHIERAPGILEHREFLDLSGSPPMRALTEAMLEALEQEGPVLMYTPFERTVINGLAGLFPDLAPQLQAVGSRLVDLAPIIKASYYHPDMLGSWSIKAVLPTVAPDMDYGLLEGVHVGTEASAAYLRAIDPGTPEERREEIRRELLQYCRHDTEAMVRLVDFFCNPPQGN